MMAAALSSAETEKRGGEQTTKNFSKQRLLQTPGDASDGWAALGLSFHHQASVLEHYCASAKCHLLLFVAAFGWEKVPVLQALHPSEVAAQNNFVKTRTDK